MPAQTSFTLFMTSPLNSSLYYFKFSINVASAMMRSDSTMFHSSSSEKTLRKNFMPSKSKSKNISILLILNLISMKLGVKLALLGLAAHIVQINVLISKC